MRRDQSENVELMVRTSDSEQWEYLIGKEVRVSPESKRMGFAVVLILAIAFLALIFWLSP